MMMMMRLYIFYVIVPLLPTLNWQPSSHAVPADDLRRPAAAADSWKSRSRPAGRSFWPSSESKAVGWGSSSRSRSRPGSNARSRLTQRNSRPMGWDSVRGRTGYGVDYDVNEDEQGPSVVSLRMPGVYVQQVCCHHFHHHHQSTIITSMHRRKELLGL